MMLKKIDFQKDHDAREELVRNLTAHKEALYDKIDYFAKTIAANEAIIVANNKLDNSQNGVVKENERLAADVIFDKAELAEMRVKHWYLCRQIETEMEISRQLQERSDAQEAKLKKLREESKVQFASLWSRFDNVVSRIGKHRIENTNEYVMAMEIRKAYEAKFEDEDTKALAFEELRYIVQRLGEVKV